MRAHEIQAANPPGAVTTSGISAVAPIAPPRPVDAIDLMKATAIALVLWQHTVPVTWTNQLLGNVWVRPAVPVFFVLAAFNFSGSLRRRGGERLSWAALRAFYARRFDRIAAPFLIILALGYLIALARGRFESGVSMLFGSMPVNAPGNYFVPALVGVIVLLPFIVWAYARRPVATVLACIALNVLFEALAATVFRDQIFGGNLTFPYQGSALRYLALAVGGVWLASTPLLRAHRSRTLLILAGLSVTYLLVEQLFPAELGFFKPGFERETNFAAAPWAILLVALGLRYLPANASGAARGRVVVAIGRASFHIFLVQMLWLGVVDDDAYSLRLAVTSTVVCFALGYAFFRLVPDTSGLLRSGARRRGSAW
jgi:peptidoglycan/LPS O-acetylase OafA/YrhL